MEMKLGAAMALACMLSFGSSSPAGAANRADARFKSIYSQEWKWRRRGSKTGFFG